MNDSAANPLSDLDLARMISRIESRDPAVFDELEERFERVSRAPLLGITGPPGVGKSTLVNGLIERYRERDLEVAVVAVDPSSPKTGGALLGDRVRMQHHSDDPGVFIRSMSSRGKLGGLNSSIYDVAIALSLAGKDLIVLETVGVGQGEVEISRCADLTAVVLVAAYGDSIQLIKAGLQEIADVFVLNKIDRYDPDQILAELRRMTRDPEDLTVRAVSAETGQGLDGLAEELLRDCRNRSRDEDHVQTVRSNHLHSLLREHLEERVTDRLNRLPSSVVNPYRFRKRLLKEDSG